MRLSRTARFLIAALLIAAATFVWVNLYNQTQLPEQPTVATQGTPGSVVVGDTAQAPGLLATPQGQAAGAEGEAQAGEVAAEGEAPTAEVVAEPVAAPLTPPVVVAEGAQVVTRDLVVEELPFLVSGPPQQESADAAADAAAGASRPAGSQRATINPFSPVVVRAPPATTPAQEVAEATPPESTPIIEVVTDPSGAPAAQAPSQSGAVAQAEPVRPPAPRAVAPAAGVSAELPRALPGGVLPSTPQILRDTRSQSVEALAPTIGDLVALREPDADTAAAFAPVNMAPAPTVATVPEPLGPSEVTADATQEAPGVGVGDLAALREPGSEAEVEVEPVATDVAAATEAPEPLAADRPTASGPTTLPLVVGADPLSRYLRDNDFRFTGTVLGPLSVGVFRSAKYSEPVVLTLGQALPDTDIILSDLRGYEARFTQGERTQTLSLDLRR